MQDESKLSDALQNLLNEKPRKNVKHIWFDFHGETHGDNFQKIQLLMNTIKAVQSKFGFFARERHGEQKVLTLQCGVFRTNCIDCLDRTNVSQARISIQATEEILDFIR